MLNDPGGRESFYNRVNDHPATVGNDFFTTNDLLYCIITSLYQHIGHNSGDQGVRSVFFKYNHCVNNGKMSQY